MNKATASTNPSLEGFLFVPRGQESTRIVTTPTFLTGELGQTVAEMYEAAKKGKFEGNRALQLSYNGAQMTGSTFFDTVIVDELVKQFGVRTPLPADLGNADLMNAVKDNHYVDSRALVLRSTEDSYNARNNSIARELANRVDLSKGPALMTGFTIEPWAKDSKGYGLNVVPAADFTVMYDDRLSEKWNEHKFDKVDEKGLPLSLDKRKGSRTWYTRKDGLSRWYLGRNLDLGSFWSGLDDSSSYGRVALFSK